MTIEKYIDGWRATGSLARRPSVWLPLVLLAVIKAVLLTTIYGFWHPWLYGFMTPAIRNVFGEAVVHFPGHVLLLGHMYRVVDVVVTVALGFPLIAWSVTRMADSLRKEAVSARHPLAQVLLLAPAFFVVWAMFASAWKGIPLLVYGVSATLSNPKFQMLAVLFGLGVSLTLRGILLYAPVYLVLGGTRMFAALTRSFRCAREWAWLTGVVVLTGWAFQAPFEYLISKSGVLLTSIGAGFVLIVFLAQVALEAVAVLYVFASATKVLLGDSGSD